MRREAIVPSCFGPCAKRGLDRPGRGGEGLIERWTTAARLLRMFTFRQRGLPQPLHALAGMARSTVARRRGWRHILAAAALWLALTALLAPLGGVARASTHYEGTPGHPFSVAHLEADKLAGLGVLRVRDPYLRIDQTLVLDQRRLWSWSPTGRSSAAGLHSVQWLGAGQLLVSSDDGVVVLREPTLRGETRKTFWSYTKADDPALASPCWARRIETDQGTCVLIADSSAKRVFAVDYDSRQLVWQYGTTGQAGEGLDQLWNPVCAEYLPQGSGGAPTVLIADADANAPRLVEVRWSDYAQGFTADSVVWRLGANLPGSNGGRLVSPLQVQRLSEGRTLIADVGGDRVIEVAADGAVTWQYGALGQPGSGQNHLSGPLGARRLANGDTLIADTENGRVIEVRDDKEVVWQYPGAGSTQSLEAPCVAERISGRDAANRNVDGATLLCDQGQGRVLLVGNAGGTRVDSQWIGCGSPGVRKRFIALRWHADAPAQTTLLLQYRSSAEKTWRPREALKLTAGAGGHSFPKGFAGKELQYYVRLTSKDRALTPALDDLAITYDRQTAVARPSGAGGSGSGTAIATGSDSPDVGGVGSRTSSGSGSGSGIGSAPRSGGAQELEGASSLTGLSGRQTVIVSSGEGAGGSAAQLLGRAADSTATVPVVGLRLGTPQVRGGPQGRGRDSSSHLPWWPRLPLDVGLVGVGFVCLCVASWYVTHRPYRLT
jgi:hypothetical protein